MSHYGNKVRQDCELRHLYEEDDTDKKNQMDIIKHSYNILHIVCFAESEDSLKFFF